MIDDKQIIETRAELVKEIQSFYFWAYKTGGDKIWIVGPYDSQENAIAYSSFTSKKSLIKVDINTKDID